MAIDLRLLTVVKSLNELRICSVLDLHRATGISRPAVHRIIECLCQHGYAERVAGGSSIRLTAQILELSSGYRPENRLATKAAPLLLKLQREIRWPHSFATAQQDFMVIQETTRDTNPFVFDNGRTGLQLPMLPTALGCAYLAFSGPEVLERAVEHARSRPEAGTFAEDMIAVALRRVHQAAERGMAFRTGGVAERTSTVAVPVLVENVAVGALCTTFPSTAVATDEIFSRFVPRLQDYAQQIAAA